MKKKQYICPEISVYEIMPTTLLAASPLEKAKEEDYNGLEGDIYGEYGIILSTSADNKGFIRRCFLYMLHSPTSNGLRSHFGSDTEEISV